VTVRVTTLKGADAGAYYVEQLPNSALDSGEHRGVWVHWQLFAGRYL
jgi:hypothetical protein